MGSMAVELLKMMSEPDPWEHGTRPSTPSHYHPSVRPAAFPCHRNERLYINRDVICTSVYYFPLPLLFSFSDLSTVLNCWRLYR